MWGFGNIWVRVLSIWRRVAGVRTGPRPVTAHFQSGEEPNYSIQQMSSLHSARCLVCPCQLTGIPRMSPWRRNRGKGKHCELAANTRWIQTGHCSGPGWANRCPTSTRCVVEDWNHASKNNLCIWLVFYLNRLSLNQKRWHVPLSWKFPFTIPSFMFDHVHFELINISPNISSLSPHIQYKHPTFDSFIWAYKIMLLLLPAIVIFFSPLTTFLPLSCHSSLEILFSFLLHVMDSSLEDQIKTYPPYLT